MAFVVVNFEVDDYDTWKPMFDEDPAGRRESGATGHVVSRAVDNPNDVFIRVEFPSVERAKAWWDSEEYRELKALRRRMSVGSLMLAPGV